MASQAEPWCASHVDVSTRGMDPDHRHPGQQLALHVVASEADWEKLAKDIRDKPGRGRVHIERRAKLRGQEHLPPGLLRLSVGWEHVEDLWDDLNAALTAAVPVAGASAAAASAPAATRVVRRSCGADSLAPSV